MRKKPSHIRSKNNLNVHSSMSLLTSINNVISSSLQKLMFSLFSLMCPGIGTSIMGIMSICQFVYLSCTCICDLFRRVYVCGDIHVPVTTWGFTQNWFERQAFI